MLTSQPRLPSSGFLKPRLICVIPLAIVFGWFLGHSARWFTDGLAVNAQLYFHAFRFGNVRSNWVWAPLRFLSAAVLQYSGLASWAFVSGYLCRRVAAPRFAVAVGALVAATFSSMAFTTTSVRIAQPRFFEANGPFIVFPLAVNILFVVVPACLGAAVVRRGSTSSAATRVLSLIAIGLAWWNANELGDALTFGCVLPAGSGFHYCTARDGSWGTISAAALTVLGALTLWDSQRRDGSRPLRESAPMRRADADHATDSDHRHDDRRGDPANYIANRCVTSVSSVRGQHQREQRPARGSLAVADDASINRAFVSRANRSASLAGSPAGRSPAGQYANRTVGLPRARPGNH